MTSPTCARVDWDLSRYRAVWEQKNLLWGQCCYRRADCWLRAPRVCVRCMSCQYLQSRCFSMGCPPRYCCRSQHREAAAPRLHTQWKIHHFKPGNTWVSGGLRQSGTQAASRGELLACIWPVMAAPSPAPWRGPSFRNLQAVSRWWAAIIDLIASVGISRRSQLET